ncbi:MAG TPA: GNAT family N-acetyltransferase [Rhabdochlamydiaceae bacterium]|jgi:ribosomal protein S18 acetylase RimI-like enzyme
MFRFQFKPVDKEHRSLVHSWLKKPHAAKWFYGQGLQNTLNHLDDFLKGPSFAQYWLGYERDRPFAFLITSQVRKPTDAVSQWCTESGNAITLDLLIGEDDYLGKGLSHVVIKEFLLSQFPDVSEVLIDPEATNAHAIHIYKKVGFEIVGEFIPSHSPHPHYMMRLSMQKLLAPDYHLERYDTIPYEEILYRGISEEAFQAKRLPPIRPFSIFLKDRNQNVLGGVCGTTYYGSLYVDSLWVAPALRGQGWGKKLMQEAEKIGKERGARFVTANTMDWEALPFYKKLGFTVEFTREGYDKDSKMFLLRKNL